MSFGKVSPRRRRDGVDYRPLTTVAGIVEKNTGVVSFNAPAAARGAIAKGDFGSTCRPGAAHPDGGFPLTNLDTTGGEFRLAGAGRAGQADRPEPVQLGSGQCQLDVRPAGARSTWTCAYLRWLLAKGVSAPNLLEEIVAGE